MQSLHKSLSEICLSSHLEGLNYCGGILTTNCTKCGSQALHYVTFEDGKPLEIEEDKIRCMTCKQTIKDEQKVCILYSYLLIILFMMCFYRRFEWKVSCYRCTVCLCVCTGFMSLVKHNYQLPVIYLPLWEIML